MTAQIIEFYLFMVFYPFSYLFSFKWVVVILAIIAAPTSITTVVSNTLFISKIKAIFCGGI